MTVERDSFLEDRDLWRERAEKAEAELVENTGVIQALRRQRDDAEAAISRVRHVRGTWLSNAATTDNITIRNWHELFAEDLEAALDELQEAPDVSG